MYVYVTRMQTREETQIAHNVNKMCTCIMHEIDVDLASVSALEGMTNFRHVVHLDGVVAGKAIGVICNHSLDEPTKPIFGHGT